MALHAAPQPGEWNALTFEGTSSGSVLDYVEVRCADTLAPLPGPVLDRPARVLAAVKLGSTRLIDNVAADPR